MSLIVIILLPILIGTAVYLRFFLKRMCIALGVDISNTAIKILLSVSAILLTLLVLQITKISSLLILHILFFDIVIQLISMVIGVFRKSHNNESTVWNRVLKSGCIPIIISVLLIISGYLNLHNVVKTNYTVYTDKDIRTEGYKVALIADVHYGISLDYEQLLDKCKEISANEPDIVVLCGDMVDNSTTADGMKEVFSALGTIKSKYGIYYVHGNHDRPMSLIKSEYTEDALTTAIEYNGINILQDETLQINDDLTLVGREDRSVEYAKGSRLSIDDLLDNVEKDNFILTLDHQPNQYKENALAGTDLILSGHTHGGQIFPVNLLQKIIPFNDGVYGHYTVSNTTQAIITSGFAGWGFPIKTAAPAEYVIIDIQKQ